MTVVLQYFLKMFLCILWNALTHKPHTNARYSRPVDDPYWSSARLQSP